MMEKGMEEKTMLEGRPFLNRKQVGGFV